MATQPQLGTLAHRHERGADTRTIILAAAEHIFAEAGLEGARMDAIAAKAGVNKALLYYYFRGKEELYAAILESHLQEFHRRASEILSADGSARSTLLRYMSLHFDFLSQRPFFPRLIHRLMTTAGQPARRLFQEYSAPLYRKLVEVVERGVRARELRPVDSHHTVYSLVALTVFYFSAAPIVRSVSHIDPFDPANVQRRKREVLKLVRFGLFREPEARLP
jgi:TetR/AcrR family transcriptional regulator